jgi:hypothetical protein
MNTKQRYLFNRRQFLKTTAAIGMAAVLPHNLMAANQDVSEKSNIVLITADDVGCEVS